MSLLRRLAESDGISGSEEKVRQVIGDELRDCGEIEVDSMGNLVAVRKGSQSSAPSIMLASHMDEVGMIVKYIRPDGYIVFELSGLIDPSILPSQWIRISTARGIVPGVIGVKAGHFADDEKAKPTHRSMWIDVGARTREEVIELGVRVGASVTYDRPFRISDNGKYIFSKALDNRIGCTVMIESMRQIINAESRWHVYGAGTVMEEIGGLGAKAVTNRLQPHVAIVLDGLPASDPSVSMESSAVQVGQGPVIRKAEVRITNCSVTPKWLVDLAVKVAEDEGIRYQIDVTSTLFSDASAINGIPTIPLLVPRKNSHSPAEVADVEDIAAAIKLTSALVKKISSTESSSLGYGR